MKAVRHKPNLSRSYTKTLFAALGLILFMMLGCASQRANSAGKINGTYIKKQDFMNSMRGHFTGFMLEKDRTPDDNEKRELYKQTWRNVTIHVILKDYFKKYQIQVTNKEVIDSLLNNIPESIVKAPVFQTNGVFDRSLYTKALLSETSTQLDWLKRHYYEYYVPLSKLKLELQKNEIVSKSDLKNLSKILNSTASIDWIVFEPNDIQVKVAQSEIENYYHSHISEFEIKPFANFGWAVIPVKFGEEDEYTAKLRADSIYFEITNGRAFTPMVQRFSNSASASNGGSLGFVKYDELPQAVRNALSVTEKNGFSRPVKVNNSWVIYQLIEQTKNLVKLNELVINIVPGEQTKAVAKQTAINLRDLALQIGLSTAASEMGFSYKISGNVSKDSLWLSDGEISAYLMDRAYAKKTKSILEPVYSAQQNLWLIPEIIDVQPFKHKPLLTVSDDISTHLRKSKREALIMEEADNWTRNYSKNALETAVKSGFVIYKTPAFTANDTLFSTSVKKEFVTIIENHQNNKRQKPYLIRDKVVIPVVSKVQTFEPPVYTQTQVREYYFTYLNPNWFDGWLDNEIRKARVSIWFSYP